MPELTNAEKRELFLEGARYAQACRDIPESVAVEASQKVALLRYPDQNDPSIVTADNGDQYRYEAGVLHRRAVGSKYWYPCDSDFTPSFVIGLAVIAQESLNQEKPS